MKYTFSDEEDEYGSDEQSVRRSGRRSGRDTPAVPSGPTVTASGRQVRSRATGLYGESLLSGQGTERASPMTGEYEQSDASGEQSHANGRATRAAKNSYGRGRGGKHIDTYNSLDEMDDEDDATSSGGSWDGDEDDEQMDVDEDDEDLDSEDEVEPRSLVVRLRYSKKSFNTPSTGPAVQESLADAGEASPLLPAPGAHSSLPPGPQLPPPAAQPPTPPQVSTSTATNGIQYPETAPTIAREAPRPAEVQAQPKQWPVYAATPPYSAPEDPVPKPQVSLPAATSASS